jgi:hypothetical protein
MDVFAFVTFADASEFAAMFSKPAAPRNPLFWSSTSGNFLLAAELDVVRAVRRAPWE